MSIGDKFVQWAAAEPSIALVALIGSRARLPGDVHAADEHSDWDFQVGTTEPERFHDSGWLAELGLKPLAYVYRVGRLSSARKVTAVFPEGEADWVVSTVEALSTLADFARKNDSDMPAAAREVLAEFSAVLQGGYQLLKGAEHFAQFYRHVATEVAAARLSDAKACQLADGFVCDYVSTLRKIERGELLAARRWVHHQLMEVNFRLLHEARLRAGLSSLPDGRRLEFAAEPRAEVLAFETLLTRDSLLDATKKSAAAFRDLMRDLAGERWTWPDLSELNLG